MLIYRKANQRSEENLNIETIVDNPKLYLRYGIYILYIPYLRYRRLI